jgi:hypothetical protein
VYSADLFVSVHDTQVAKATPSQQSLLNMIKLRKTSKSVSVVTINSNLFKQNTFDLNLRADLKVRADVKSVEKRTENDFTVFGKLANIPGDAVLVVRGNNVTGTINTGKEVYRIKPLGSGLHALILVDQTKLPEDHPPAFKAKEMRKLNISPAEFRKLLQAKVVAKPVIELIVSYTAAAKAAYGSDIEAMIQLAVSETNQGYQNSGINASVHLAHMYQVNYGEKVGTTKRSFETILAHFAGNGDGFMDEIHTLRETYKADVAVLIIDQNDWCGLADAILATKDSAFALVYYDCATGYYSFGHEIGHLLGARHNPEVDSSTDPFSYGHGYLQPSKSWRTIMAYPSGGLTRINYWSNPNVMHDGVPMGTAATHDNARVLRETVGTVAAFKYPLTEDCIPFNPATTTVKNIHNSWKIVDGDHWMFDFKNNKTAADKSLEVIKSYKMNRSCFVGRPDPSFTYLLVGNNSPVGDMKGQDCLAFNPATIEVKQIRGSWKIIGNNMLMYDFGNKKDEADMALKMIKKYGFTKQCFVARPNPPFQYLHK